VSARVIVAAMAVIVAGARLPAQQAARKDTVQLTKIVQFAIPNAPAMDFIGQSPDEITRPTSARALAAALLSGVNSAGKPQQGFAIEIAPGQLLAPNMDLREYQSTTGFLLSNLALSVGSVQAAGDTTVTNLGIGARAVLLDRTDPLGPASRAAGDAAITSALLTCLPRRNGIPVPVNAVDAAAVAAVKSCVAAADTAFRNAWRSAHWNDYAFSLSLATGWGLRNSTWAEHYGLGGAVWALGAAPLCFQAAKPGPCGQGQWLVKLQYERRDSADATRQVDELTGGLRATYGSSTADLFLEDLYRHRSSVAVGAKQTWNDLSAGIEFRLTDVGWVSAGIGSRYDELSKESKAVVLAGLRFNISPKQQFGGVIPKLGGGP
jgi:hypothetical protein